MRLNITRPTSTMEEGVLLATTQNTLILTPSLIDSPNCIHTLQTEAHGSSTNSAITLRVARDARARDSPVCLRERVCIVSAGAQQARDHRGMPNRWTAARARNIVCIVMCIFTRRSASVNKIYKYSLSACTCALRLCRVRCARFV